MVKTLEGDRYALCEKLFLFPVCCSHQMHRYLAGCFGLISGRHCLAILLQNPSSNQKKTLRSAYFKPLFSVFIIRFSLVDRSLSKHQSKLKPPPLVIIIGVYSTRRTFPSLRVIVPSVFVKSRTVSFPLLRQYRTNELVRRRMNFSSDAMADFEGLLEVNRKICKQQMAEKASPTLPTNCAVLP